MKRRELHSYGDVALFAEIALGDEDAFDVFFYRYNTKVYHFILHIVKDSTAAEELIHDVFLKLWLNRKGLASIENPGNYLFVVSKNHALHFLEKPVVKRQPLESLSVPCTSNPEDQLLLKEGLALIAEAVRELPDQQRLVFQLSSQQGLSRDEIALKLNVSPHTVKNHLGSARKSIQQYMQSHGKIAGAIVIAHIFFGPH